MPVRDHLMDLMRDQDAAGRAIATADRVLAPIAADRPMRRHVEGSIARALRTKSDAERALYPSDNRTGVSHRISGVRLEITADVPIVGLDTAIDT
jgi:hypothetical protein